jgi:hypothetical protein
LDTAGIIDRIRNPPVEQTEEDDDIVEPSVTASEMNKAYLLCSQLSDLIHKVGDSQHVQTMYDLQAFLRQKQFETSSHQSAITDFLC